PFRRPSRTWRRSHRSRATSRCRIDATTSSSRCASPSTAASRPIRRNSRPATAFGASDAASARRSPWACRPHSAPATVSAACERPPPVRPKPHSCGFGIRDPPRGAPTAIRRAHRLPAEGPLVVATVGGGSDGFPVLDATLDAVAKLQKERPNLNAILVTGPLMPSGFQDRLRAKAPRRCRVISRADNFQLMAAADAIVSMGGYNSVCEALSLGRPLVIVPRATHKIEQQIRAETLAARGLAQWVHPKELDGARLAEALRWALARDPDAHGRLVRSLIPSFDGAARLTEYLARWLGPLEERERPP